MLKSESKEEVDPEIQQRNLLELNKYFIDDAYNIVTKTIKYSKFLYENNFINLQTLYSIKLQIQEYQDKVKVHVSLPFNNDENSYNFYFLTQLLSKNIRERKGLKNENITN